MADLVSEERVRELAYGALERCGLSFSDVDVTIVATRIDQAIREATKASARLLMETEPGLYAPLDEDKGPMRTVEAIIKNTLLGCAADMLSRAR